MQEDNRLELLLPAGNLEKLETALRYGADAVYLAGKQLGLRAKAGNFTLAEMERGIRLAHRMDRKVYVAVNIFAHNRDMEEGRAYLERLEQMKPDGLILSDPGVFRLARQAAPGLPVHISTQANVTNWQSVLFWQEAGAERVVLGREVSLEEMTEIRDRTGMELEVFVHGAMCMSYSGRCMLSMLMTGRSANRGECTHPCRWRYGVAEEQRPGEYLPVEEDDRGTYIFNSKDLCMLPHLDRVIGSGATSLKIEGRMKSVHYVATVAKVYRQAIDRYLDDPAGYRMDPQWMDELLRVSDREYCSGFYFGSPDRESHNYDEYRPNRGWRFCGRVLAWEPEKRQLKIEQRNRFFRGDRLELLIPGAPNRQLTVEALFDDDRQPISVCPHPRQTVYVPCGEPVPEGTLLRLKTGDQHDETTVSGSVCTTNTPDPHELSEEQ